MAMNNPYQQYKQNTVDTKSPGELTLMLYDGCLKFIKRAETAIRNKQIEVKNENLLKAQNIIRELMLTLNTDVAVSRDMMTMYDYILSQLIEANTKNNLEALKEAERYTADFRETWKEVIKLDRQQRHTGSADQQAASKASPGSEEEKTANLKAVKNDTNTEVNDTDETIKFQSEEKPEASVKQPAVKPNPNNPYAKAKAAGYGAPDNPYAKVKRQAASATAGGTSYRG